MSSNFTIPIKKRHVLIHVYDQDSGGPRHHDIPALELRLRVYQTATLRSVADAIAKDSQNRHDTAWTVGKILDRDGDEFVDPAETVWGALDVMPICIVKAAPMAPAGASPSRAARHRAQSSAWKATTWNAREDEALVAARAAGTAFSRIQAQHFPSRTAGSCQKRYKRLMTAKAAGDKPVVGDVGSSPQVMPAPQVQPGQTENHTGDTLSPVLTTDESEDESEDEPLLLPVLKATDPRDAAHVAATRNTISGKTPDQHHGRKARRESADKTRQLVSAYDYVEHMEIEPAETPKQTRLQNSELIDPADLLESEQKSSPADVTGHHPNQRFGSSKSNVSPTRAVEPKTPQAKAPSSSLDEKENLRHTNRKPMSLTPIKVRGKRHDKPKEASKPTLLTERERARQRELEYDATLNANLRRAKQEAERQTSVTKLERAERLMQSLYSPPVGVLDEPPSSSPFEMDSSPTARVARNRHARGQGPMSPLSLDNAAYQTSSRIAYQDDAETPSSPPIVGGWDTPSRRVHFDQDDHDSEDQLDGDVPGRRTPQECEASLPVLTNVVDDVLKPDISSSPPGSAGPSTPEDLDALDALLDTQCHQLVPKPSPTKVTKVPVPKVVEGPSRRDSAFLEKSKRPVASSKASRSGTSHSNKNKSNPAAKGRHQIHGPGDRVSKSYGNKKAAKKRASRKPGF